MAKACVSNFKFAFLVCAVLFVATAEYFFNFLPSSASLLERLEDSDTETPPTPTPSSLEESETALPDSTASDESEHSPLNPLASNQQGTTPTPSTSNQPQVAHPTLSAAKATPPARPDPPVMLTMQEKLAEIKRQMAASRKERGVIGTKPTTTAQANTSTNSAQISQEDEDKVDFIRGLDMGLPITRQDRNSKSDANMDTNSNAESQDADKFEFNYEPEEMEIQGDDFNSDANLDKTIDANTNTETQDSDETEEAPVLGTRLQGETPDIGNQSQGSWKGRLEISLLPETGNRKRNFPSDLNTTNDPNASPTATKLRKTTKFTNINCEATQDMPGPFEKDVLNAFSEINLEQPKVENSNDKMPTTKNSNDKTLANKPKERPDVPPILRNGGHMLRKRRFPTELGNPNNSSSTAAGPELRNAKTFLNQDIEGGSEVPGSTDKGNTSKNSDDEKFQDKGTGNNEVGNSATEEEKLSKQNTTGEETNSPTAKRPDLSKPELNDNPPKFKTPVKVVGQYKNCDCCLGPHLLKADEDFPSTDDVHWDMYSKGPIAKVSNPEKEALNTQKPKEQVKNFSLLGEALAKLRIKLAAEKKADMQAEGSGKGSEDNQDEETKKEMVDKQDEEPEEKD